MRDTEARVLVWIVLLMLFRQGESLEHVTVTLEQEVPAERLVCWTCETSQDCISLNRSVIEKRTCHLHEFFCKVQKLTDDKGIKLLERSCARECKTGCIRVKSHQRCEECCTTPLCNVGNGASRIPVSQSWFAGHFLLHVMIIDLVLRLLCHS